MHIIHVVRQFYPAIGGLENFVLDLAKEQLANGLRVSVVTLNRRYDTNQTMPSDEVIKGIAVKRIPYSGSKKYPLAFGVHQHLQEADVIHVHAVDFFADFLAVNKIRLKKPLVLSTHGGFFHTKFAASLKKVYFNTVTRASLLAMDKIVTCSTNDHSLFEKLYPNKTVMIENGVNVRKFARPSLPQPNKQILFIGRFSDNKRVDTLIRWFAALQDKDPEFTLVIAGKDWDNNHRLLVRLVEELNLNHCVSFVLDASEEQLSNIVASSTFIASASEYEGFGMTIIEAMAGGLVPLMSSIESFKKIHQSTSCGILLDFNDADSTQAVLDLYNDKRQLIDHQRSCLHNAQQYDWRSVSMKFQQVYESIA
jgi:alpha-1,3-mannosyltransferase